MPAVDTSLAHDVRLSVMRLARRMRQQRTESPLGLTHLAALATLERHGEMTPGELAQHERVQPPSMTRVIGVLEDHGLIERRQHATDGRQVLLTVSTAGTALLKADRRQREAWLATRMRELTPEELTTLRAATAILERLAAG